MKKIYDGKTKNVYQLEDGNYLMKFKDDATGTDGIFDPGANTVGLSIEGLGRASLRITEYFFRKINAAGFRTHFVEANIEKAEMTVLPAKMFGKGIEVICRCRATGSFIRRYGEYIEDGAPLPMLVEVTLKDDDRGDPLITRDALDALGILTGSEYDALKDLTQKITCLIKDILESKGMELYDIKLEFGRSEENNDIILMDEISGGNMRVYKDGQIVEPMQLAELVLDN